MIKKVMVCDKCGAKVEKAFRIMAFTIDVDEMTGDPAPLSDCCEDYCPDCLSRIQHFVETMTLGIVSTPESNASEIPNSSFTPIDPTPEEIAEVSRRLGVKLKEGGV